jgi:hypothetical protein
LGCFSDSSSFLIDSPSPWLVFKGDCLADDFFDLLFL